MTKAKNKDVLKKLKDVDTDCLENFDEAARILLEDCRNDPHMAIKKCLAYASGNFKSSSAGGIKSLLTGRDGYQTIKMSVEEGNQLDSSLVMEIIRRFWSPRVEGQVRNMKDISDQTGVVFDLRVDHADAFMDNFDHMKATQGRKVDFECVRCKKLPPMNGGEGGGSSYSRGGNGFGGGRGGGGGGGFGRGPRDDRSPRGRGGGGGYGGDRGYGGGKRHEDRDRGYGAGNGNNSNSGGGGGWGNDTGGAAGWSKGEDRNVIGTKRPSYNNFDEKPVVKRQMTDFNGFGGGGSSYYNGESTSYSRNDDQNSQDPPSEILYFGNINYKANENDLMEFVADLGFQPLRARMNVDKESGKSKGSAFIQMSSVEEASCAIKELNNEEFFGRQLAVRFKAQHN